MRWISVEDRLPEVEGEYLVFYKYKGNEDRVDIALFSRFGWHKAYEITHWQPLPEPPSTRKRCELCPDDEETCYCYDDKPQKEDEV